MNLKTWCSAQAAGHRRTGGVRSPFSEGPRAVQSRDGNESGGRQGLGGEEGKLVHDADRGAAGMLETFWKWAPATGCTALRMRLMAGRTAVLTLWVCSHNFLKMEARKRAMLRIFRALPLPALPDLGGCRRVGGDQIVLMAWNCAEGI